MPGLLSVEVAGFEAVFERHFTSYYVPYGHEYTTIIGNFITSCHTEHHTVVGTNVGSHSVQLAKVLHVHHVLK